MTHGKTDNPPKTRRFGPLVDTRRAPAAVLRTLSHMDVAFGDESFWGPRLAATLSHTLPLEYEQLERAGNIHNLVLAAEPSPAGETGDSGGSGGSGGYRGPRYMDSDLYKWMEAAALGIAHGQDSVLRSRLEFVASIVASAQDSDGYINSYYQVAKPNERWTDLADGHELYCMGHLIQAAIAMDRNMDEPTLMPVATKLADYLCHTFGPNGRSAAPGHPEIELALVELFRATGESRYLALAEYFIDQRGRGVIGGRAYHHDHLPVREMTEVAGHAVRQLYLLAGVTDLYIETGDAELLRMCERVWDNMVRTRMHIHGGVGSRHDGEAFGEPRELPNDRTYSETCAQIAAIMWSWRMLLATGHSKYADLVERLLYNGFLSGIDLAGERFFYPNALLSRGGVERQPWFSCACCPPNIARMLASIGHYIATITERGVHIHLYDAARIVTPHATLRIETEYPWDGTVHVQIEEGSGPFFIALRVPGWCAHTTLTVNDERYEATADDKGYLVIDRNWHMGDELIFKMSIDARLTEAHPLVDSCRGCVAIERGPLVYCVEQAGNNADVDILSLAINPQKTNLTPMHKADLLGGVTVLNAEALIPDSSVWTDSLYRPYIRAGGLIPPMAVQVEAIPYYAWANRGPAAMRVWIPIDPA